MAAIESLTKKIDDLAKAIGKEIKLRHTRAPQGTLSIYAKATGGDDANDGLTKDTPVKTIARALEIIQWQYTPAINSYVRLYLDKGPWGSVGFQGIAPTIMIAPYDTLNPTDITEDSPRFTQIISMYGSHILSRGVWCDYFYAHHTGYIYLEVVNRVGILAANAYGNMQVSGVLEFFNTSTPSTTAAIINSTRQSFFGHWTAPVSIRLYEDIEATHASFIFCDAQGTMHWNMSADKFSVDLNGHTFGGPKYYIGPDSAISTYTYEDFTALDKFPGEQAGTVKKWGRINGQVQDADLVGPIV